MTMRHSHGFRLRVGGTVLLTLVATACGTPPTREESGTQTAAAMIGNESSGTTFAWARGQAPVTMSAVADGFCMLTSVRGMLAHQGDNVQIAQQQGRWVLQGASESSDRPDQIIAATASCYPWATFGAAKSFALSPDFYMNLAMDVGNYVQTSDGSLVDTVHLWDSQSFCWLDSIGGVVAMQSVHVQADSQGNRLTSRWIPNYGPFSLGDYGSARCATFGHGGPIPRPGAAREFSWSTGAPETRLASASAAVCYLSGIGNLTTNGSAVYVTQRDGSWWLGGGLGSSGEAECITLPGDTPFTDPHMWTPRLEGWCAQAGGILGVADMNGDGRSDLWCHDPMNGSSGRTWVALATDTGFDSSLWAPWLSGWCGQSGATFGTADFNADARADFWCHDANATWVALSSGTGTTGDVWTPWMSSWCGSSAQTFGTADITGDARADFWCHDPGGTTWVAPSAGDRTAGDIWTPWMSGWCGSPGQTFGTGSFNSDAKGDFYCHDAMQWGSPARTWVALSNGGSVSASYTPWLSGWCGLPGQTFGVADFDADGSSDLYCHDPAGKTWVARDLGGRFDAGDSSPWLSDWCADSTAGFGVADFNGDGRADVWCHNASATWTATSTGAGFGGDPWTPKLQGWCSQPGAIFSGGDFNGDRDTDFLCHDPMGSATSGDTWIAFR